MNKIIDRLLLLADKAELENEVPVSAIVLNNGVIVGEGYNQRISKCDVTAHAEIIAIKEAEKKLGDWRLNDCDLYVLLEPCNMCKEVIKEARLKNVYYFVEKSSHIKGFNKTNICLINGESLSDKIDNYKSKISKFFEAKR